MKKKPSEIWESPELVRHIGEDVVGVNVIVPGSRRLKKRIPYKVWSNSQLSVAKYYGGIDINGKRYNLDYINCKTTGEGENKKYFPDLVEE